MGLLRGIPWLRLAGPLVLVVAWFLAASVLRVGPLLLPTPQDTFARLWRLVATGEIGADAGATAVRWLGGCFLGCAVGVPVGMLTGASRRLYSALEFPLDFFRSLPVTALFPLFLLLFGIRDASKIAMVFAATVFVVILNSAYGVFHSSPARPRMARAFGASRWQVFARITVFEALPGAFVGMRTALSLSLVVVVVSEMFIGTSAGLGQRVFEAYQTNSLETLYAVILLLGTAGYLANRVFVSVEKRVVFWAGK